MNLASHAGDHGDICNTPLQVGLIAARRMNEKSRSPTNSSLSVSSCGLSRRFISRELLAS